MRARVACLLLLATCVSAPLQALETPAVLESTDAKVRAVLSAAVSELLQGADVTLGEDALLHDSWLTVERVRPRDGTGQLLQGRILERPEQFQLRIIQQPGDADQCLLIQRSSGRRKVLESVGCRTLAL